MNFSTQFKHKLLKANPKSFEALALELFQWQAHHNPIYRAYLSYLKVHPTTINTIEQIPCLPIEFFKHHRILSGNHSKVTQIFESSGTTGQIRSKHYVPNLAWYHQVCETIFTQQWGQLQDFHIFALLPSYLERNNASLVSMADYLIRESKSPYAGFYLNNFQQLVDAVEQARQAQGAVLLLGVTFALLDLAEQYSLNWSEVVIMETGGMKGRRKELTRPEVHQILRTKLGVTSVASEYGMTELLSQAYARSTGQFAAPPWMKVMIRDIYDPFAHVQPGKQGGINIIDLANVDSCAFIETKDLGRVLDNRLFEVLGRYDNSEIRGCNLMV
ncbi:acyl transferase [Tunicatimonas pelagia]|uniref:LuxE/PaaK family acyltransferase n=1 Tax=Tunicatimonas pelagia TaxID=931531 RepID=UPI002665AC0B|nr:acyl transferase [Tunicatimonas pelagia]WKN42545.1 acyl transferase [Tunicatimonas pelagia]